MKSYLLRMFLGLAVLGSAISGWSIEQEQSIPGSDSLPSESLLPESLLPESPLGVRQARVERMMRDLEKKFTQLAQVLETSEKAQAERLIAAFQESKKLLLKDRMSEITDLLDDAKLESAGENQAKVMSDLRNLMELLLTEEDEAEKIRKEIAALEKLKKELAKMVQAEHQLLDENEEITDQDAALSDLDQQISKVKELIKKEEKVADQAEKAKDKGLDELDEVADKQRDVRKETEKLAAEMAEKDNAKKPGAKEMAEAGAKQKAAEKLLAMASNSLDRRPLKNLLPR